ncbi:hypothetical protein RSSM_00475 [Rhodopirellula sallentina SM41]|uniref:Uncharacterized protein n=1 Tax=Rhodopirellula sallentina SM41 TaxID=1263870 RepID=M5UQ18_9BACT|nr:hypothetical protein RSSM_00475 [Rhodopirellula sallentina SM41]
MGCDTLLWIGDNEHPEMRAAWRVCQQVSDVIAIRGGIAEATERPPRSSPTHVIVAQSNRHDARQIAIDGESLPRLRSQFPDADMLVVRGRLVAPTVRLPERSVNRNAGEHWVDSVPSSEAESFLRYWLTGVECPDESLSLGPIVVVSSVYQDAEPYIETLRSLPCSEEGGHALVQWQRTLTRHSSAGFATVLWDDSVAVPCGAEGWRIRCERAPGARHVWMTGLANESQRQIARENGVDAVVEKPGRLACLVDALI